MRIPNQKSLVIHERAWKYANENSVPNGGQRSLVVRLQYSEGPTLYQWLEPFLVPYHFDFTTPNLNDQRPTQLLSKHLWVPEYRSNLRDEYEKPKDRGVFKEVKLVRDKFTFNSLAINFMPESRPHEATSENDRTCSLPHFLKSITGWTLLDYFVATKVHQHHKFASNKGSRDVFCFQKDNVKRIAIRKENGNDESKIEWTTAILINPHATTKTSTLEVQLSSVERGRFLTLASIRAAAEGPQKSSKDKKSETWSFTVQKDPAKIYQALTLS